MNLRLAKFWADAHANDDGRWVTGTGAEAVLTRLGVVLGDATSVLEIGPGKGDLAQHLRGLGKTVVVHDIVPLEVEGFAPTLPLAEKVDIAIAHLVLQHVPDHERLILQVLASLRPGGTFYFDAVTREYDLAGIEDEFRDGLSFPFIAWHLVTGKTPLTKGWYACRAVA